MSGDASQVLLRPLSATETTAAAAVLTESRRAAVSAGTMPQALHSAADVESWFAEQVVPHREVWVAHDVQSACAVAVLVLDVAFLDHLYVLPHHARAGIGTNLLQLAMALRPDGFELWTFASNRPARALYAKHGLIAVEFGDGQGNEEGAPDVRYAWRPPRAVNAAQ